MVFAPEVLQATVMLPVPEPDEIEPPAETVHTYPDIPAWVLYVILLETQADEDPLMVGTGNGLTVTL